MAESLEELAVLIDQIVHANGSPYDLARWIQGREAKLVSEFKTLIESEEEIPGLPSPDKALLIINHSPMEMMRVAVRATKTSLLKRLNHFLAIR